MTGQFPPAAVIFTALAVERSAVVAHLTHTDGVTDGQGIVYTVGDFDAGECKWKVAVAELGAGNAETAAAVSGAALFFDPRAMFFAGVAGGRKDVGIGDVVAGSTVLQIESGKEDAGGMLPRPRAVNASFRAEQLARAIATGGEWRARVGEKGDSSASAVVGAIGSGERVVADAEGETATRLAEMYSNVIAVEMEGYGFLTAMRRFPVVETIVVRGVSDLLSDKADADASGSQELAAANAAAFAFEVLAQLPCEEGPRPEPQFFAQELATAVAEAQPAEPIVVELRSTGLGQTRTQRDHEPRGLRGPQFLSTLRQDHPADAELIETEVGPAPSRETLADLALSPPDWLTAASDRVWEMLAQFADDLAEWPAATTLFQEAATRADAPDRRVLLLTRAAGSADLSGDTTLGEELLEHAVELNPAHPSVAFERARRESDPARRLAILESIEPDTPDRHAYFAAQRAIALLELGDLAAAKRAAAEATALNPDLPNVREASATVDLVEAGTLRRAGRPPDYDALGRAAETFLRLREDLISVHRWEESAAFLGRAVDALVFSARDADAAQLVQSARPEELEGAGGAHIALAALDALDFERAVELLHGRQDDDQTRVAYAAALLSRDHDEFRREGVSLLKAVLDHETSAYRSEAAWVLAGSMVYIGEFDEGLKALRHLEEVDSPRAALVRAQLVADEDPDAADTILLPHQSDLRVLRFRVAIATQAGNRDRALKLFDLFLKRERDPEVRLWRAEFLESVSETGASLTAYTEAARDATAPTHLRRVGYNRAARLAQSLHRYEDLSQLVREWRELEPDNRRLIVHEVAALVELARYADAEHVLADANFEPASQEEAALVGEVVYWTMEGEERLTRLIALSDRFDRAEPTLELKIGVLGASAHESVTEAVRERATRSLVEFAERFPESNAVAAVPVEQMVKDLEEPLRSTARGGRELYEQLLRGEVPVAVLAAHAHKPTGEVWDRLTPLPLGFGDSALDSEDLRDAEDAIDEGAVIDASTLYVLGGLGEQVAPAVVAVLPRAVVPESVVDDAVAGALDIAGEESAIRMIHYDLDAGGLRLVEIPADQAARERARARGALELARRFRNVPDSDPDVPGAMNQWLRERDPQGAVRALAAALAVAERTKLPLYADDRVVRIEARRLGIPTFGTFSIASAMAARELLTADQLKAVRGRLLVSGAHGVAIPMDELLDAIRSDDFGLTETTSASLRDPGAWRHSLDNSLEGALAVLESVSEEAPGTLELWTRRIIDAVADAFTDHPTERIVATVLQRAGSKPVAQPVLAALEQAARRRIASRRRATGA